MQTTLYGYSESYPKPDGWLSMPAFPADQRMYVQCDAEHYPYFSCIATTANAEAYHVREYGTGGGNVVTCVSGSTAEYFFTPAQRAAKYVILEVYPATANALSTFSLRTAPAADTRINKSSGVLWVRGNAVNMGICAPNGTQTDISKLAATLVHRNLRYWEMKGICSPYSFAFTTQDYDLKRIYIEKPTTLERFLQNSSASNPEIIIDDVSLVTKANNIADNASRIEYLPDFKINGSQLTAATSHMSVYSVTALRRNDNWINGSSIFLSNTYAFTGTTALKNVYLDTGQTTRALDLTLDLSASLEMQDVRIKNATRYLRYIKFNAVNQMSAEALVALFGMLPNREGMAAGEVSNLTACPGFSELSNSQLAILSEKNYTYS